MADVEVRLPAAASAVGAAAAFPGVRGKWFVRVTSRGWRAISVLVSLPFGQLRWGAWALTAMTGGGQMEALGNVSGSCGRTSGPARGLLQ